jgi:hypothetical protein
MSLNRENVIWKSRNGSWYIGFFDFYIYGDDPEWDVEYNWDVFRWSSGPHDSEETAASAWRGANPGGYLLKPIPGKETDHYDKMFAEQQKTHAS